MAGFSGKKKGMFLGVLLVLFALGCMKEYRDQSNIGYICKGILLQTWQMAEEQHLGNRLNEEKQQAVKLYEEVITPFEVDQTGYELANIFLEIVKHPADIVGYSEYFRQGVMDEWEAYEWFYSNPDEIYDCAEMVEGELYGHTMDFQIVVYPSDIQNAEMCGRVSAAGQKKISRISVASVFIDVGYNIEEKKVFYVTVSEYDCKQLEAKQGGGGILPAGLNRENFSDYKDELEEIFLDLVIHPEEAEKYSTTFTEDSFEKLEEIQWYYEEPQKFYDTVLFDEWYELENVYMRLRFSVVVGSQYYAGDDEITGLEVNEELKEKLEQDSSFLTIWNGVCKVESHFNVEYDPRTGALRILSHYFLNGFYGL